MKLINGTSFFISLEDPAINAHFNDAKNYTKEILHQFDTDYYIPFLDKEDRIVLDIGANIGLFTLHVLPFVEKIYSIEPTTTHFNILQKLTAFSDKVVLFNKALSNTEDDVTFYITDSNTTMNSLLPTSNTFITVKACTLKSLVGLIGVTVDFCKIDIEGSESIALTELEIASVADRVKKFFVEFHAVNGIDFDTIRKSFIPIFEKYGYTVQLYAADSLFCKKRL
jgi:FkbM family methyltransferase